MRKYFITSINVLSQAYGALSIRPYTANWYIVSVVYNVINKIVFYITRKHI